MIKVSQGQNRQGCRFLNRDILKFYMEKGLQKKIKDKKLHDRVKNEILKLGVIYCTDTECYCDER